MSGYTHVMKIAVSLPDELYRRADAVAEQLGLNRSQLYARALEQFLVAQGDDPVTATLDELADILAGRPQQAADAGRRLIDSGRWEW